MCSHLSPSPCRDAKQRRRPLSLLYPAFSSVPCTHTPSLPLPQRGAPAQPCTAATSTLLPRAWTSRANQSECRHSLLVFKLKLPVLASKPA
eukprot:1114158-Rhodomonas_salina.1